MANPIDTKVISKLAEILDRNQLTKLKYEDESCKISLVREVSGAIVPTYAHPVQTPVAMPVQQSLPLEEEVKDRWHSKISLVR